MEDPLRTSGLRPRRIWLLVLAGLVMSWAGTVGAEVRRPLLQPGKKTIYQRVITHPGAAISQKPGSPDQPQAQPLRPFTVLYVYSRETRDGQDWLEVGPSSAGEVSGWIKAGLTSDWKQAMTLVLTDRTGRQPVLFFKDSKSLMEVCSAEVPGKVAEQLASRFEQLKTGGDGVPKEFPLLAMEPSQEAVPRRRFYLIPIFQVQEPFEGVKFLEVASIDPGLPVKETEPATAGAMPDQAAGPKKEEQKAAIAFVIDTTISMKPYIERCRRAVVKIYDAVEKAGLADRVAFGLVAFRNSIQKTPGLEYTSRVVSDFKDGTNREEFEKALAGVDEAKVSSHSFDEDAFAGLKTALEKLHWEPYHSRLILLITDAGSIRNDDPFSSTGMNETEMADLAAASGVKIFALHLRTPAGQRWGRTHAQAETQYRTLTRQSDPALADLYIPVEATDLEAGVEGFGRIVEGVAATMVEMVRATTAGQRFRLPAPASLKPGDPLSEAEYKAAVVGYAMQLDFLGQRGGIRAPQVVTSWIVDKDLAELTPTVEICVLLNKNQLSDLYQRLKIIRDEAQRTKRTGAKDFFQGIMSAAAAISRDPIQFSKQPNLSLQQLGVLGEYLEDLPYKKGILRLTEEDWLRMSVGEQQAFIDTLKSKMRRYEEYHDDVENWETFGAADPGEAVYRIPLSMLP